MARSMLVDCLATSPVVGVLRGCPPDRTVAIVEAAVGAGLRAVEVTMDSKNAAGQLAALARSLPPETAVGAGTVRTIAEVDLAIDAGASFIVSPSFDAAVVARSRQRGVDAVPGVLSPTEIASAVSAGATMCKLFPAGPLGAGYLRALLGPFPEVPFVCTGGVDATNAASFIAAGASGVGVGGEVFDATVIRDGDTAAVAAATSSILRAVRPG